MEHSLQHLVRAAMCPPVHVTLRAIHTIPVHTCPDAKCPIPDPFLDPFRLPFNPCCGLCIFTLRYAFQTDFNLFLLSFDLLSTFVSSPSSHFCFIVAKMLCYCCCFSSCCCCCCCWHSCFLSLDLLVIIIIIIGISPSICASH